MEESSQFSSSFVKQFFEKIFTNRLRKTQFNNLCLGIFGLIGSQSGLLSEIVRDFPSEYVLNVRHKHRLKRLNRFLANVLFRPEKIFVIWVKWCAIKFGDSGHLPIAIDWTALPGNYNCLMAAIPFFGRAIPLYFRIASYGSLEKSQNKLEDQFLKALVGMLPKGIKPLILADRGFGRADLFLLLLNLKIDFCIRVKSEVWITLKDKDINGKPKRKKLSKIKVNPKRGRWWENITYREDGIVTDVNLGAARAEGSADPWFLVTNLPNRKEAISRYAQRFQIEEFFKDAKHQLGIANAQTPKRGKIHRLLCLACLGYGLLTCVGQTLEKYQKIQSALITNVAKKGVKTISYIWLALKAIRHNLIGASIWREVLTALGP